MLYVLRFLVAGGLGCLGLGLLCRCVVGLYLILGLCRGLCYMGLRVLLVEMFFVEATGRPGCGEAGARLLGATAHLVKARSVATAAAQCVFMARLGETMGVRGFYHSVLPGKGEAVHLVLALAFPRVLREHVGGGSVDYAGAVGEAFEWLKSNGVIDVEKIDQSREDEILTTSEELARAGVEFVEAGFRAVAGGEAEEALARSRVLAEQQLMSYRLHVWGVADVIVEDPVGRYAVVVEWKSFSPDRGKTAQVTKVDTAQAYVYAMLEAERLGLAGEGFESYVSAVLGEPPGGAGARVVAGVVRPSPTGRASRIYVKHPRLCLGARSCDYRELRRLMAGLVLAAEHLTLSVTDPRRHLEHARNVEEICSVATGGGRRRPVFRLVPELVLDGDRVRLPMGYPLDRATREPLPREKLRWPCNVCPDNVREACVYYLSSGYDPRYADFRAFRSESWRARFAVYAHRENALAPYRLFRELALMYGSDMGWIRGRLASRVLPDGSRVDLFDEAWVDGDELVLARPPLRWERENMHLFTLREGKPAAVFLNEEHVRDPLLRAGFHGSVSGVEYDERSDRVYVRVAPANKLSRIYPALLEQLAEQHPGMFRNVVALEVNVELTQLELLGITAAEMGTVRRGAEALEKLEREEQLEAEDVLALLFGGVRI